MAICMSPGQAAEKHLKKRQLIPNARRHAELRAVEFPSTTVEAKALGCYLEATTDLPGIGTRAAHALAPFGVIVLAATHRAYKRHDMFCGVGPVLFQPFAEEVLDLERKAQQHEACRLRACIGCACEYLLDLTVVERGDDRRDHDAGGHARLGKKLHRLEAARRRRGARLHRPGELCVERRHRNRDLGETTPAHIGQNVEIARHPRRLGDDGDGMIIGRQNFQNAARDAVALFDRLIGIGVRAHGDGRDFIPLARQFPLKEHCRIGLRKKPALEIEARREPHIGMRRSGKAVDAAMLAASIGIDRAVEGNVGR